MSHKKAQGSSSNGRDSNAQRLGVKLFGGEFARPGCIIIRQHGTKFHPGVNVLKGKDDTLFSKISGFVKFSHKKLRKFDNSLKTSTIVSVIPLK
jgi:large subunit ribosomal protein L27